MMTGKIKALCLSLVIAVSAVSLIACRGAGQTSRQGSTGVGGGDPMQIIRDATANFPITTTNNRPGIGGGTLRIALPSASSFTGMLDTLFTTNTVDSDAAAFIRGPFVLFSQNPDLTIGDNGVARITEWNHEEQFINIVMQREVYWHDGVRLTLDDLVFAYETISNPAYTGIRWTNFVWNVQGTHEYRAGTADRISGLVLSEDRMSLRMYFTDWSPALQYFGFWTSVSPRHHLQHIPVAELAAHPNVRRNTLGFGPFRVEEYVPGESYLFVRNENYFLGTPGVERIVFDIIPNTSVPMEAEAGNYDILMSFAQSQYVNFSNPTNYTYIADVGRFSMPYMAFSLGHYDTQLGRVVTDPNAKMRDVNLRRAMAMAVPWDEIGQFLFSGLVFPSVNIMVLAHEALHDPSLNFFRYNPEEAMRILDEAGYIDIDGCGFRENPDGSKLEITFLFSNPGTPAAEMNINLQLQSFQDIGLNAVLYQGRTVDFQVFVSMANDTGIYDFDVASGAWATGSDPNPNSLWGPFSQNNRARHTSPRFERVMETIRSDPRMWDPDFARATYHEYQRAFYDEVPSLTSTWAIGLRAVNNRVKNFGVRHISTNPNEPSLTNWWLVELTENTPFRR